jgi:hypothetical protein
MFCITSRRSSQMHSGWGSENLKKRDYLQGLRGRIMYPRHWIYLAWNKKKKKTGCHEHDIEPPDSMKYRNVFTLSKRDKFLGGFGFFVWWILKATVTHREYVIFIALLLLRWLGERAWMLLPVTFGNTVTCNYYSIVCRNSIRNWIFTE